MRSIIVVLSVMAMIAAGFLLSVGNMASPAASALTVTKGPALRYRIDAGQSKFMVHAFRGGLAWFKGHDHFIAVRDFGGEAFLTLDAINPASLEMTIQADSLEETGADFTTEQKGIIKKELNEIVLETAKYPEITFKSTGVKGEIKDGKFEIKIAGDITLHGVTKPIEIPATVSIAGDDLHAAGEFKLDRKKI